MTEGPIKVLPVIKDREVHTIQEWRDIKEKDNKHLEELRSQMDVERAVPPKMREPYASPGGVVGFGFATPMHVPKFVQEAQQSG